VSKRLILEIKKKNEIMIIGIIGYGILYFSTNSDLLVGYTHSDFASNVNDMKRTSIYVFHLGLDAI